MENASYFQTHWSVHLLMNSGSARGSLLTAASATRCDHLARTLSTACAPSSRARFSSSRAHSTQATPKRTSRPVLSSRWRRDSEGTLGAEAAATLELAWASGLGWAFGVALALAFACRDRASLALAALARRRATASARSTSCASQHCPRLAAADIPPAPSAETCREPDSPMSLNR